MGEVLFQIIRAHVALTLYVWIVRKSHELTFTTMVEKIVNDKKISAHVGRVGVED